ncbi:MULTISPECIES: hypothetical protein [Dactylosporangium]|uniref:Uncharacterized protein n=2 Tax=Dactylosporangium TaxID=35753 RepID=A0A9W6NPM1_9ACTN|nr:MULTISPECIES: hypothetical protein [Dactylosporangium]UAB99243.1 hypothetical protein Dvina_14875 [Dactylosporangium vinaceum]UWZ47473.1 hypothetical protein Dmats_14335 [Dactylosporangium matsuzakiense]GLL05230.1 hypothetical protein GCM10017581_069770 [Dactylosporangium matsuzakiense]
MTSADRALPADDLADRALPSPYGEAGADFGLIDTNIDDDLAEEPSPDRERDTAL